MANTAAEMSETESCPEPLLDRASLIRRWQHGSDAFFWRAERAGRLRPVFNNGLLRYRWHDVLLFEGGLPPAERAAAYSVDLMHPDRVATICNCRPDHILEIARKGRLPVRRIGRARRFVPAEVALWQKQKWNLRAPRMNRAPRKTDPVSPDE